MGVPHKCPICNGKGEITQAKAKHDAVPIHGEVKNGKQKKIFACHGCNGTGLLWDWTQITFGQPQPMQPWIDNNIRYLNDNKYRELSSDIVFRNYADKTWCFDEQATR